MKKITFAALFLLLVSLPGWASLVESRAELSLIDVDVAQTDDSKVSVSRIDHYYFSELSFFNLHQVNENPGIHIIGLSVCRQDGKFCRNSEIECNTLAGYIYKVARYGCTLQGRRMDFDGADSYWAGIDADPHKKAAEVASIDKQIKREQGEATQFAKSGVTSYALQVASNRQAALAQEANRLNSFRDSLAAGVESNCGPVIEVKESLVKVSHAVANFGNEHWIRRKELFPAGYGCRFNKGEYQPPPY